MSTLPRRRVTRLVVPLIAASLLAACGGEDPAPSGGASASQPAEKVTLTVALFSDFHYAPLYEEFKKTHPNVTITERRSQFNDHHNNLVTQLATGAGAADVVAIEGGFIATFQQVPDKFYNLADYGLTSRQSEYLDWKWQLGLAADGKTLLGLGTDVGGLAMCYRPDLFKKAGLPTNRDEVSALWPTWDAYVETGKKFVAGGVKDAAFTDGPGEHFRAMVEQAPVGFYDASNNLVVATNPDVKKAFDMGVSMIQNKLSGKLTAFTPEWTTGIAKGTFATMVCPAWKTGVIKDQKPGEGTWDIAAVPGGGGNQGGTHLMAPKQGKHPKEAAELINFLTSKESQLTLWKDASALPSLPALYEDPAVSTYVNPYFGDAPIGKIFTDAAKALKPQHTGPKSGDVLLAMGNGLSRVELQNQAPEEAWAQAVADAEKIK
ncbi:ABC transporter substrate-binding protein [Acrocarpospora macrocephala]|uniref:ABC transporter substrate-binding protein n=1 Tax=Acrocarpospora macrocephala TaxID=150177 RepID=A0A5M3X1T1_9ACTN|nr:ABC transporter substrate-binding protein [Acrocarpospora macrocephala]GES14099.1 ABC transporter substrate-binding protein [Acrocarpospora macrocephala]